MDKHINLQVNSLLKSFLLVAFLMFSPVLNSNIAQDLSQFQYSGIYLKSIRVPIGGVGTGNILIGGRANIEHMEVFNRPDRNRKLVNTFFALWMKEEGEQPIVKLMEREKIPPYTESTNHYAAGLPRFQEAAFTNTYPLPAWRLSDPDIPLEIELEVYNPFVPLDLDKSSYPIAEFEWNISNPTNSTVQASIVLNIENPIVAEKLLNAYYDEDGVKGVRFLSDSGAGPNYKGSMLILTKHPDPVIQTHLYPGRWRDDMHLFWDDFSTDGKIDQDTEDWPSSYFRVQYNQVSNRNAVIQVSFTLSAGQSITIPYYIVWYFPDRVFTPGETFGTQAAGKVFSNYYKTLFSDENDVIGKYLENRDELYQLTKAFSEIMNGCSFPPKVVQGISTQVSTLKTNLIQVTEDRDAHGFEGVNSNGWCCPGTCTHVWNYEQTLAFLYPSLERNMREIEFLYNTTDNGFQSHRSVFPLGDYHFDGGAAADGQMGSIVRVYREWKLSGDNSWLRSIWPKVKKALEFAWYGPGKVEDERFRHQESQTPWDPDKDGILTGRQHNTYDISFFGPSSMTTSVYLAALKACSEMAQAMGEPDKSGEYLQVYQSGVKKMENILWNGSYFVQIIADDPNAGLRDDYELSPMNSSGQRLPKYQYGDGSLADQLLGQYLAHTAGLGYIISKEKADRAIQSVYRYNFIPEMRDFHNVQRVYAINDESGVVLCAWPHDNRPLIPFVYADEVWTGVEYQVAASLIYSDFVDEGIKIVEAVQDRYDGYKRNPFEHDESGVHYARAMSSWAVLLALSGFEYDGVEKSISFAPKINFENFKTFWSTGSGWGEFTIEDRKATLTVVFGSLEIAEIGLGQDIKISPLGKIVSKNGRNFLIPELPILLNEGEHFTLDLE
jgi:non-lysosomal glucosylceramidase